MSDSDDDDDEGLDLSDPTLDRIVCGLAVVVVVMGVLVATRTTIFDKIKGSPLTTTDGIVAIVGILAGSCILCCCITARMSSTRQRAVQLREQAHLQQQEQTSVTVVPARHVQQSV
jgi:hypothetical protein